MRIITALAGVMAVAVMGIARADSAKLSVDEGTGANPALPQPVKSTLPTINVARAVGWSNAATPTAAAGTQVTAFATGLDHPRWLYVLPNGDVLVAESNGPARPDDSKGIRGWFMKRAQRKAGAGSPSAERITLLRDTNGDGVADQHTVFLKDLHSPFGMVLVGSNFYVADTDALLRFPYESGADSIGSAGTQVTDLPAGTINHHWTKNVIASADGAKLYVTVGSNSNVADNGIEAEAGRAAIWEVDAATGQHRVFATGLRNPNGMAWEGGTLWTVVNERDELGSDLVPDYLTSVQDGAFYGWPYSYYGQHVDERVKPQRPDLVATAIRPDYALGPHTASLGLASAQGNTLPERFRDGMFVGQHGSWNRKPFSGYRVIFVPFGNGKPAGPPLEVLSGFLDDSGAARGRPVGVAIDTRGGLLVADDVGNTIWRVSAAK
jgi:glucose/arabinose dehydrogenase